MTERQTSTYINLVHTVKSKTTSQLTIYHNKYKQEVHTRYPSISL